MHAYPARNQTAHTTAEILYNKFKANYGFPSRLHSDQGPNFTSKIINELCRLTNMDKSRTTPYHPMGNGMCELFNRTLLDMLGTLKSGEKKDWKSYITPLTYAYNCIRHETYRSSPICFNVWARATSPA